MLAWKYLTISIEVMLIYCQWLSLTRFRRRKFTISCCIELLPFKPIELSDDKWRKACLCRASAADEGSDRTQNLSEWRHKAPYDILTQLGACVCRVPEVRTAARSNLLWSNPTSAGFPETFLLAQQANSVSPRVREVGNVYCKTNSLYEDDMLVPKAIQKVSDLIPIDGVQKLL